MKKKNKKKNIFMIANSFPCLIEDFDPIFKVFPPLPHRKKKIKHLNIIKNLLLKI